MNSLTRKTAMIKDIAVSMLCIILSFFIKRRENYLAFGSWCGDLYNDNSKYLAEYIAGNYPEFHIIWVGKRTIRDVIPAGYSFVELNSMSSVFTLLKCKKFFFTQMHRPDICRYNVYRGADLCLLDHGNTLKKWAMDAAGYHGELEYKNFSAIKKIYTSVVGENHPYRFITVSSRKTGNAYRSALAYRMDRTTEILETGLPRNDILLKKSRQDFALEKAKYAELLGFDPDKKVVLYLPTYRRKTEQIESFANRDRTETERLNQLLEQANAVLLEKNHFAADQYMVNKVGSDMPAIVKVSVPVDVQEMLEFADILISDYSGCILDYLLLDRPIVYYVYDYQDYRDTDSGLYYDITEYAAGPVAYSFDDVYDALKSSLIDGTDDYVRERESVRKDLTTYDDGHSCERVCKAVLNQ